MSTMSNDPGIICFQHCDSKTRVFAFKFPDICSVCKENLSDSELRIPPFRVPCPFRDASSQSNVIVIKPTIGDFLNNYENSTDLHIGVTDSTGCVYEFDVNGKEKTDGSTWTQCLPVKIVECITSSQKVYFDRILNDIFNQAQWDAGRYNSENHNCYTFVLTFLRSLYLDDLQPYLRNKTIFCEEVILCQTRIAAKYISLYRQIKANNIVVQ